MRNPMRSAMMMTAMLAMMAPAVAGEALQDLPDVAGYRRRPEGYGVHLSKAERRGKSVAELQRLRAERLNG